MASLVAWERTDPSQSPVPKVADGLPSNAAKDASSAYKRVVIRSLLKPGVVVSAADGKPLFTADAAQGGFKVSFVRQHGADEEVTVWNPTQVSAGDDGLTVNLADGPTRVVQVTLSSVRTALQGTGHPSFHSFSLRTPTRNEQPSGSSRGSFFDRLAVLAVQRSVAAGVGMGRQQDDEDGRQPGAEERGEELHARHSHRDLSWILYPLCRPMSRVGHKYGGGRDVERVCALTRGAPGTSWPTVATSPGGLRAGRRAGLAHLLARLAHLQHIETVGVKRVGTR